MHVRCCLFLMLGALFPAQADDYHILIDVISPYTNEVLSPRQSRGMFIEVVEAAMDDAGLKLAAPSRKLPWRRAQSIAKQTSGSLIFPFARTALREDEWQWVSVVANDNFFAYAVDDRALPQTFDDLKSVSRLGVLAGGAPNSIAQERGFQFDTAPNEEINFYKLILGRVDVILSQGYMAMAGMTCVRDKMMSNSEMLNNLSRVTRSQSLQLLPLWLATSLKTPPADVAKLRHAIEDFKKKPEYEAILARYTTPLPLERVNCLPQQLQ